MQKQYTPGEIVPAGYCRVCGKQLLVVVQMNRRVKKQTWCSNCKYAHYKSMGVHNTTKLKLYENVRTLSQEINFANEQIALMQAEIKKLIEERNSIWQKYNESVAQQTMLTKERDIAIVQARMIADCMSMNPNTGSGIPKLNVQSCKYTTLSSGFDLEVAINHNTLMNTVDIKHEISAADDLFDSIIADF